MTYDDRDTVCQKGKFRLEEFEDVNYSEHCFYNGDEPLEDEEVVILLSDLTTENEELKLQNKQYSMMVNANSDLNDEIYEQLQKTEKNYKSLLEENEQLKKELKDYHNAFDCSQCRYHNYNWFDDGDEFEVCDKGNDEAQMEYHSCKDWEKL